MEIDNFNSLFELMAAINVAFIAVEYTKSYTNVLSKKVFKLNELIENKFGDLMTIIIDRKSIETIGELQINGANAYGRIESCKRESEKIKSDIESEKDRLLSTIERQCEYKSFSCFCLWSFFYCVVALIFSGFREPALNLNLVAVLVFLSAISLIYFTVGWIFGEKEIDFVRERFSKLHFTIYIFVIALMVSFFLGFLWNRFLLFVSAYRYIIIPLFVVIPFVNFIVYFTITYFKIKTIKRDIEKKTGKLSAKCSAWSTSADQLIIAHSLVNDITAEGE